MSSFVIGSRPAERVVLMTLNRPEKLNALSIALVAELAAQLDEAEADDTVGCAVITGNGRAFSAGADIADQHKYGETVPFNADRLANWAAIERFGKPLVAAVNGYALGGGNELAMIADIIIASEKALFGQPEIRIGIFPGDGGTQRLVRAVGKSMAMQMILGGQNIDAATARQAGLASEVVPHDQLLERTLAVASGIAAHSLIALKAAKKAMLQSFEVSLSAGLVYEREALRLPFASDDRKEGMAAFLERRPPSFKGR
ncbi:MAG: enoyl-CoA hydratase-related protein [Rhizobiaceae bacterium]